MLHSVRLALLISSVFAASSLLAEGSTKLQKAEAQHVLTGKTMEYLAPNGDQQYVRFSEDGQLTARSVGIFRSTESVGTWLIESDGKVCISVELGPMANRCYYLIESDGVLGIASYASPGGKTPIALKS